MFIHPVKRASGHFLLVSQFQENSILFTFMDEFKRKGFLAPPYLIVTMFQELRVSKELALVRGDVMDGLLSRKEAETIWKNLLTFYLNPDLYEKFVYPFNNDADRFSYSKYADLVQISAF